MIIEFSDEIKRHKHFSKVEPNTWLVQSDPESTCQAYYVTVLPHAIVMYGDYDGVIVKPHAKGKEELMAWMRGATTLSYFAEKVTLGNRAHKTKEWQADKAKEELLEYLQDTEYTIIKNRIRTDGMITKELLSMIKEMFEEGTSYYHFENKISPAEYEVLSAIDNISFEEQHSFWEGIQGLQDKIGIDVYEWFDIGMDYTNQLKWQQQCLLWWAHKAKGE